MPILDWQTVRRAARLPREPKKPAWNPQSWLLVMNLSRPVSTDGDILVGKCRELGGYREWTLSETVADFGLFYFPFPVAKQPSIRINFRDTGKLPLLPFGTPEEE